jgi:hypothetical protein
MEAKGTWDMRKETVEDRGWTLVRRNVGPLEVACRVPGCRFCESIPKRHRIEESA